MQDSTRRQRGLDMISKVYGSQLPAGSITPPGQSRFIDYMLETLFSELWSCETLSFKERRLLLLGVIAAQGEEEVFAIQASAALDNGEITEEQLKEIVLFLTQYAGYPKASKLHVRIGALLKARAEQTPPA